MQITKTTRLASYGDRASAKTLLIALHGYGQLVPYFIRKFHQIDSTRNFVVAPEGLHRFYLNGTSGRVGASWMTKEARLDDIEDNINYLNQVYQQFVDQQKFDKIIVLGFSQGAATAVRWIENTGVQIDAFIQWAGVFPPDLELDQENSKIKSMKHFYVVGKDDPYFSASTEDEYNQSEWLKNHNYQPETMTFDGKHDIDSNTLNQILDKLV